LKRKEREQSQRDFSQLKRKVLLQAFGMVLSSFLILLAAYFLFWKDRGGDFIVFILRRVFRMDSFTALNLYQLIFRNNKETVLFIAAAAVFFILFYFSLRWFVRYFNEINRGIDALLESGGNEIILPPEMAAVEKKLNAVRQALEKREMEAQLAEQRKNDLVMYLAHDIRTPLTSVIGYLSLLDEAPDMPPKQKAKYIHITLGKAYRLEKLVNEFFEITRYNLQQIRLEQETIDLYYMLVQLTDEFYPILSANGNRALLHADENLTVYGDPVKLARVFNNILKNAAAYSYPNSEISISAEKQKDCVVITFQNQGPTIPMEKLTDIFEKFYRMDAARTTDTGGAGLGLSIAKEIVIAHGGEITAQSKDETTTFIVSLPLKETSSPH
jgi:two-component system sensor histidine kinase VanS